MLEIKRLRQNSKKSTKPIRLLGINQNGRIMINSALQNEILLVEWVGVHSVEEDHNLDDNRVELKEEDSKISSHNLVGWDDDSNLEDSSSILETYSVEVVGLSLANRHHMKKNQKKKSKTSMSQKLLRFRGLIFSMIPLFL